MKQITTILFVLAIPVFVFSQERMEMQFDFYYNVSSISGDVYIDPYGSRGGGGFEFGFGSHNFKTIIGTFFTTPYDEDANFDYEGMFTGYTGVSYQPNFFKINPYIKFTYGFASLYMSHPEDYLPYSDEDFGSIYEITGKSLGLSIGYKHMFTKNIGASVELCLNRNKYSDGDDKGTGIETMIRIPNLIISF